MSETATTLENALEGLLRRIIREEIGAAIANLEPNGKQSPTLLTVQELAESLKVKKSWVYDLTRKKKGSIPHIRVGRYPRFELSRVLAWLDSQKKS